MTVSFGSFSDDNITATDAVLSANRMDNTLSGGRRILVEGPTALASVAGKEDMAAAERQPSR